MTSGFYVHNLNVLNQFLIFYVGLNKETIDSISYVTETVEFRVYDVQRIEGNGVTSLKATNLIANKEVTLDRNLNKYKQSDDSRFLLGFFSGLSSTDEYYWEIIFRENTQFD